MKLHNKVAIITGSAASIGRVTALLFAKEGATLHHFDEKLFLLKDQLNTETAKKIAIERDNFMH